MKLWTWDTMLAEGVESHPEELDAFNSLSRIAYASFEEWLGLDMLKCDLATVIVGCRCPEKLWRGAAGLPDPMTLCSGSCVTAGIRATSVLSMLSPVVTSERNSATEIGMALVRESVAIATNTITSPNPGLDFLVGWYKLLLERN